MRRVLVKLGAVGIVQLQGIPRVFDTHYLHPQAKPEIRRLVFPRKLRRHDLAFDTAIAESTRHDNAVQVVQFV